jgi:hypothetical protein
MSSLFGGDDCEQKSTAGTSDAFSLTKEQQNFLDAIRKVCAPHLSGADPGPKVAALGQMPRRYGSTTVLAVGAAELLAAGRDINILVAAPSQASGRAFLQRVLEMFVRASGTNRLLTFNIEKMTVRSADGVRVNTLTVIRDNAIDTKGLSADVIILESPRALSTRVLSTVVAPLLKVKGTVLLASGAPLGGNGNLERLCESKTLAKVAIVKKVFANECTYPPWIAVAADDERTLAV